MSEPAADAYATLYEGLAFAFHHGDIVDYVHPGQDCYRRGQIRVFVNKPNGKVVAVIDSLVSDAWCKVPIGLLRPAWLIDNLIGAKPYSDATQAVSVNESWRDKPPLL